MRLRLETCWVILHAIRRILRRNHSFKFYVSKRNRNVHKLSLSICSLFESIHINGATLESVTTILCRALDQPFKHMGIYFEKSWVYFFFLSACIDWLIDRYHVRSQFVAANEPWLELFTMSNKVPAGRQKRSVSTAKYLHVPVWDSREKDYLATVITRFIDNFIRA